MTSDRHTSNRREFLKLSGALAAGSIGVSCSKSKPSKVEFDPAGWIDAHVHIWSPDLDQWPLGKGFIAERMKPPSFTPEELFAECRPEGVSRIVLIQMSFYRFDNRYMLRAMRDYPGVFAGVAVVDAEDPEVEKTMRDLKGQGVRGFRIRATAETVAEWPSNDGMKRMWRVGAEEGLSMCCLADADSLPGIHQMCELFPQTPVVIDHCGRIGTSGTIEPADVDHLCALATFPTVQVKTSAFYALGKKEAPHTDLGPMIRRLRDAFGAERLMWASDCPYQVQNGHTYHDSIALIRDRLDFLSEEEKNWILRDTAERVFFT
ncbi:MAG: amidohydrolase [Verrucomicrobiae bacterium]|nr:amidohydrolase [Verrucomicrobiae bacterium]